MKVLGCLWFIVIQVIALGHLPSLGAAREVVRESMPVSVIQPRDAAVWNDAFRRFTLVSQAVKTDHSGR